MPIPFSTFRLNLLKKQKPRVPSAKIHNMMILNRGPEKKGVDITKEIIALRKKCLMPGYDVNTGLCVDFAHEFTEKFGGQVMRTHWNSRHNLPGHAWIVWNGKHYDAENPQGVRDWKKLKFFRRAWNKKLVGYYGPETMGP